jgi:hypothetical protein
MTKRTAFAALTATLAGAGSLGLLLVLAEGALRVEERLASRTVRLDYADTWRTGGLGPGGALAEGFSGEVIDGYGGTVRWVNNSSGFRHEREIAAEPTPGVLRLLSLGDSFTAGYRVGQHQTFSHCLEVELSRRLGPVEVPIACVEDPPTGLDYLVRFGQHFHPQALLLGITLGNDIAQSYLEIDPAGPLLLTENGGSFAIERREHSTLGFRHGLETYFVPETALAPQPLVTRAALVLDRSRFRERLGRAAWPIASWYGDRRRPRLFDPTHGLGFFLASPPDIIDEAFARLERVLAAYDAFCDERGIVLLVALFPQRFQVQPDDWERTVAAYGLAARAFDLEAPNRRIAAQCRALGLTCIDPTEAMRRRFERTGHGLYLPRGDMHWNGEGHEAFCEAAVAPITAALGGLRR